MELQNALEACDIAQRIEKSNDITVMGLPSLLNWREEA